MDKDKMEIDGVLMFRASKTESIIRSYDEEGKLTGQVFTSAVEFLPVEDGEVEMDIGMYL